jgi:hypothetical protein
MARKSPWANRTEEEDDIEYVVCPICQGGGRGCRYCAGHGDVHPDDVDAIAQAFADDRRKKTLVVGLAVGVTVILLVILIVMLVVANKKKPIDELGESKPEPGKLGVVLAPPNPAAQVPAWVYPFVDLRVDMMAALKGKDFARAVQCGEQALTKCQDPALRPQIQQKIDEAKARLAMNFK